MAAPDLVLTAEGSRYRDEAPVRGRVWEPSLSFHQVAR
ncbi:hypothetical protein OCO_08900 [Mycobacterium intracellulare MOTT-02]|uniref:Methylcitrate synthase n=1 Tax=Mycobacterium indicus pranii (strain DSM 45239 / MTCC 9506) TaxID=1232724 RepID=J9W7F5_MYCIP|nr:hypothetical protein OCO_08900 [Mycobacterium intracellulare MOTT-02]AFS13029.1 Methylcitrate synthase [Mycobacterium intracellulare subsp. intracellulare MTCC 9506]